jgi:DNA-directed RNA polymerase subunit RPC12/RpoP
VRWFWHIFKCSEELLGYSAIGTPIYRCPVCDSHWILAGRYPTYLRPQQARNMIRREA